MRTWIVAFWTYIVAHNAGDALLGPTAVSVLATILSFPASVLGNEASIRFGRHRIVTWFMFASAAVALVIGAASMLSPWLLLPLVMLYGITVPSDSGSLTSGMSESAAKAQRGATMALHSTVGFGASALGAWGTGVVLDLAGGPATASGWFAAFALMAAGALLGPVALLWSRRSTAAGEQRSCR
jgi:MFS family permease